MDKFHSAICLLAILCAALMIFSSCGSEKNAAESSATETATAEQKQADQDIYNMLTEMYSYYNSKDFDTYMTYWDIDETEKATMLDNFKSSSGLFDASYKVDGVSAVLMDDGTVNVKAIATSTSKNVATGSTTVLQETMYYVMAKNDAGQYRIKSFTTGGTELVSQDTGAAATTAGN